MAITQYDLRSAKMPDVVTVCPYERAEQENGQHADDDFNGDKILLARPALSPKRNDAVVNDAHDKRQAAGCFLPDHLMALSSDRKSRNAIPKTAHPATVIRMK